MKRVLVTFMVALFATFVFGQAEIKPSDAPKCLADWLTANMKGFTVDKIYKIDKKVQVDYVARVIKDKDFQWLYIEKECSAVKKISKDQADQYIKPNPTAVPPKDPPKPVPPKPSPTPTKPPTGK
jgi:hypothetical protein